MREPKPAMDETDAIQIELNDEADMLAILQDMFGEDILEDVIMGPRPPSQDMDCGYNSPYGWVELVFRNGRHVRVWNMAMMQMVEDEDERLH